MPVGQNRRRWLRRRELLELRLLSAVDASWKLQKRLSWKIIGFPSGAEKARNLKKQIKL
ncbi:MAG: hypothetical protein WCG61_02815 [Chlorobium sp.]